MSVALGLACGIMPAARAAGVNLAWLRDASRGSTHGRHWTRDGLVVAQAALALLLLVGSGLLLRSFAELRSVDPGYDTQDIFTFQMAPQQAQLTDARSWSNFHHAFMERLRGLPGVETVGIVEAFPLTEFTPNVSFSTDPPAGGAAAAEQPLNITFTAGDYFEAMGIRMLRGRMFTEAEQQVNQGHVILSQSTAERLWPGEDPLGRQLTVERVRLPRDRHRRGRGRPAERLPRLDGPERLFPARRTESRHSGRSAARGTRSRHLGQRASSRKCALWFAKSRPKRRCTASTRSKSSSRTRWPSFRSR